MKTAPGLTSWLPCCCCCSDDSPEQTETRRPPDSSAHVQTNQPESALKPRKMTPQIIIQEPTPHVPRKESLLENAIPESNEGSESDSLHGQNTTVDAADAVDAIGRRHDNNKDGYDDKHKEDDFQSKKARKTSIPLVVHVNQLNQTATEAQRQNDLPMVVVEPPDQSQASSADDQAEVITAPVIAVDGPAEGGQEHDDDDDEDLDKYDMDLGSELGADLLYTNKQNQRKISSISTMSDWSWPVYLQDEEKPAHNQSSHGLTIDLSPSRKFSKMAPAPIDSPLAKQITPKFTQIIHEGK